MTPEIITYLTFGGLLVLALIFDLGLLSKQHTQITIRKALWQTVFWVTLALAFFVFVWIEFNQTIALEYLSAYLTEWSLSIDNIFVFILIFSFFAVKEDQYARVLLIGIIMAIVFRVIFITIGIVLIERFEWLLYIFGAILVYTGIKMFASNDEEVITLEENRVYKVIKRILPLTPVDNNGRFTHRINGKRYFTSIFVVVIMLASTDIIFALDSIPAVFGISKNRLVIYTSNIFAVLGLRSLFFLLKGAKEKFAHLQQGIAVVLVFIGLKMLAEIFHFKIPVYISLLVILVCIAASIVYSIAVANREEKNTTPDAKREIDLH
jgi:tellurite resistance protein TerC